MTAKKLRLLAENSADKRVDLDLLAAGQNGLKALRVEYGITDAKMRQLRDDGFKVSLNFNTTTINWEE